MNKILLKYLSFLFCIFYELETFSIDTLYLDDKYNSLEFSEYIYVYKDSSNIDYDTFTINEINDTFFKQVKSNHLNFGIAKCNYIIKFVIKSNISSSQNLILHIANPDIDRILFYEFSDSILQKKIVTGEQEKLETREFYHRHFVFNIFLEAFSSKTFYISFNNIGHALNIPINLQKRDIFTRVDNYSEIINWFLFGLIFFIFFFNLYLFYSTRDKVNIYYSFYVLSCIIFFAYFNGYIFYFDPSPFISRLKYLIPAFIAITLLNFTKLFILSYNKFKSFTKITDILQIFAIVTVLFTFFNYPLSLVADNGAPFIILFSLLLVIITSALNINRNNSPSILLFVAFVLVFVGLLTQQFLEFGWVKYTLLSSSILQLSFVLQCILLTIAVLERFRIQQEQAKQTIQNNYEKIQSQQKEILAANEELEKLSIVASETENAVAIYNPGGELEWCNAGFERIYDLTLEEIQGENIKNIIEYENFELLLKNSIDNQQPVIFETQLKTKRKRQIWVQTTLTPYISDDGKFSKLITVDSDISELKAYEHQITKAKNYAEQADKLKTIFLANMSHEIRTPLNGILGFTDMLRKGQATEERRERYLGIISESGKQLLRIIDDILDISLIESNQLKITKLDFQLNAKMREIYEFFMNLKKTNGKDHIILNLKSGLQDGDDIILSDPFRLQQVLNNLLRNAFKFSHEGEIMFGYKVSGEKLEFFVQDTGIGVEEKLHEAIFERFRQGEEVLKRSFGGNGLGLPIAKGIIEQLGGDLWIDKKYNDGARFYFTVPYVKSSFSKIPSENIETNSLRD